MMYQYNPVLGYVIPVGTDGAAQQRALAQVKADVGDDTWKRGNSLKAPGGVTELARKALKAIGYEPPNLVGKLVKVTSAETRDASGNVYQKCRVELAPLEGGDPIRLSLELDREETQTLIQKLDKCTLGQEVMISFFQVPVERAGRNFVNHKASLKSGGQEVRAEGFWREAQDAARAVEANLAACGIKDKTVINKAKASKVIEAHAELLKTIEARFNASPAPAAPAEPAPANPAAAAGLADDI